MHWQPVTLYHISAILPALQVVLQPKDLIYSLVVRSLHHHHLMQHATIIGVGNLSLVLCPLLILTARSPYPRLHHHLLPEITMFLN